ncbi:hypothetical protein WP1_119 [Pseudomonas phage WP1]
MIERHILDAEVVERIRSLRHATQRPGRNPATGRRQWQCSVTRNPCKTFEPMKLNPGMRSTPVTACPSRRLMTCVSRAKKPCWSRCRPATDKAMTSSSSRKPKRSQQARKTWKSARPLRRHSAPGTATSNTRSPDRSGLFSV